MIYQITEKDYADYVENAPTNRVNLIWNDIVNKLENETLKQEARATGFVLVESPSNNQDAKVKEYTLVPPTGSAELGVAISAIGNLIQVIKG